MISLHNCFGFTNSYMVKKTRILAICALFIYCFLFLFANSPLHIYLFHRNGNSEVFDCSVNPHGSLIKSENNQQCPLCKFLNLTLFQEMAVIYIILIAFLYLVTASKYKTLRMPAIHAYHSLAPPISIS